MKPERSLCRREDTLSSRWATYTRKAHWSVMLAAVLILLPVAFGPAFAQQPRVEWSDLVNLSDSEGDSRHPSIVADAYGYVHVLWSEDSGSGQRDTIAYTRWNGHSWLPANDVLFVPGENVADYVSVDVDQGGRLHAVWTGQSLFYYASAPGSEAHAPRAWTKPLAVAGDSARSQLESDILVADAGELHIVYATRLGGAGVYHIRSDDEGSMWTSPSLLSQGLGDSEIAFGSVKLIEDGHGRLHVVWQTFNSEGFGQAVYYTRSLDDGRQWENPIKLASRRPDAFETGWPYISARGNSELHIVYVDGPDSTGRYHRVSGDGGATWGEPLHILSDMVGINGYVIPVLDGAASLHLIVNMRPRATQVTGIYYAQWTDAGWSSVTEVTTGGDYAPEAHRMEVTVRLGNEFHVVYYSPPTGDVWCIAGRATTVTPQQPLAVPTSPVQDQAPPVEAETLAPAPSRDLEPPGSLIKPQAPAAPGNPLYPVFGALLSVLLVMGAAFAWYRFRSRP